CDAQLAHDLRSRTLERPTTDDRRDCDRGDPALREGLAYPRHCKDRCDAEIRIGRADHDAFERTAAERCCQARRHARLRHAIELDAADWRFSPAADEIVLK